MSVYASAYNKVKAIIVTIFAAIGNFFVKEIKPGQPIPRFYGFGWYKYQDQGVYVMPLGLNLIASGARALYYGSIYGFRSRTEGYMYRTAFTLGSGNGFKVGYFKGYQDGKGNKPNAVLAALNQAQQTTEDAGVGLGSGQKSDDAKPVS